MIRAFILAVILAFASIGVAHAQDTTANPCTNIPELTKNKSTDEIRALLDSCRTAAGGPQAVTAENASKWSEAAKGFAQALGIAAKELGVAANDFIKSPAGFLLILILMIKFCGSIVIATPLTVFVAMFWWYINRRVMQNKVEYTHTPVLWGLFSIRRVSSVEIEKDEYTGVFQVISGIIAGILLVVVWCNV